MHHDGTFSVSVSAPCGDRPILMQRGRRTDWSVMESSDLWGSALSPFRPKRQRFLYAICMAHGSVTACYAVCAARNPYLSRAFPVRYDIVHLFTISVRPLILLGTRT